MGEEFFWAYIRACVWPIYFPGDKDGFAHSQAGVLAGYGGIGAVIVNILGMVWNMIVSVLDFF